MVDSRTGYNAFELYLGLKLHFNSDYDFVKYNGKVKTNFDSYLKRSDKFHFGKLAKNHGKELKDFLIANFIIEDYWAGDLLTQDCENNYTTYKKYMQSLSYSFEQDCRTLQASTDVLDNLFCTDNTTHPIIVSNLLSRTINPITFGIIESRLKFIDGVSIKETYVWPEVKNRMKKLIPFLPYDEKKITDILLKVWSE